MPKVSHTIKSLRLDLKSAREGRTWLLLPDGFRDKDSGYKYPLPTGREELRIVSMIIPAPRQRDSGTIYIERAYKKFAEKQRKRQSAMLDIENKQHAVAERKSRFDAEANKLLSEARNAVETVKNEATKARASVKEIFDLGLEGILGQMQAHMAGEEWRGEKISAKAFRDIYQLSMQTVKGLGLPSDHKPIAQDAVLQEVADSLKDTKSAIDLAPGNTETEN